MDISIKVLKILVCIKEILDDPAGAVIDPSNRWFSAAPVSQYRMNGYDEYALEEAVTIKEKNPGTIVDVLSLGTARVEGTLRKALEKGADSAYRCDFDDSRYMSPGEKAAAIAAFSAPRNYHIVFTGIVSEDTMNGQVGPMTAAILGIPCSTAVVWEEVNAVDSSIEVESELEGGVRARCRMSLPVLLAVQSGINIPRYPSLSNKLRAKNQKIELVASGAGKDRTAREAVQALSFRGKISRGTVIEGSRHDKAAALIRLLHERSLL